MIVGAAMLMFGSNAESRLFGCLSLVGGLILVTRGTRRGSFKVADGNVVIEKPRLMSINPERHLFAIHEVEEVSVSSVAGGVIIKPFDLTAGLVENSNKPCSR